MVEFEGPIVCTAPSTQIAKGDEGMSVSGTLLMRLGCFKKINQNKEGTSHNCRLEQGEAESRDDKCTHARTHAPSSGIPSL